MMSRVGIEMEYKIKHNAMGVKRCTRTYGCWGVVSVLTSGIRYQRYIKVQLNFVFLACRGLARAAKQSINAKVLCFGRAQQFACVCFEVVVTLRPLRPSWGLRRLVGLFEIQKTRLVTWYWGKVDSLLPCPSPCCQAACQLGSTVRHNCVPRTSGK